MRGLIIADARREMGYVIDAGIMAHLLKGGTFYVESSIPKDAQLVSVSFDINRNAFRVQFRHESFPIITEGDFVPVQSDAIHVIENMDEADHDSL